VWDLPLRNEGKLMSLISIPEEYQQDCVWARQIFEVISGKLSSLDSKHTESNTLAHCQRWLAIPAIDKWLFTCLSDNVECLSHVDQGGQRYLNRVMVIKTILAGSGEKSISSMVRQNLVSRCRQLTKSILWGLVVKLW
jgi:hypothetical protein